MDHQFKRLLNLVRRTGDRLVVTDPNGEDTYVLMGLEAYEKLAEHLPPVEPEPWDKPRHFDDDFLDDYYDEDYDDKYEVGPKWEIPDELTLDSVETTSRPSSDKPDKEIWDVMPLAGDKSETWNPEKFDEEEKKVVTEKFPTQAASPHHSPAEDSVASLPSTAISAEGGKAPAVAVSAEGGKAPATPDEPGEEQFYLEPIE